MTDRTFFTNEPDATLLDRFKAILRDTQFFDILVGYFRTTGFYRLHEALESIDKIRILVGLGVDRQTVEILDLAEQQQALDFESHGSTQRGFSEVTRVELDDSEDSYDVERGVRAFIEYLTRPCTDPDADSATGGNGKKLEIRAYPSSNLHAKVYISRYHAEDRDFGSVVTGSSNFSESGLIANREFNVELKNKADVEFALSQFETLWRDGVDVSRTYTDTIQQQTWLNDQITPYELYLKMLYEYLQEDINLDQEEEPHLPTGFLRLEYQKQAVVSARKTLGAYNGIFLADVVGLGKTFISALLAQQLPGGKLILCPPVLKDYWEQTFFDFSVRSYRVESIGKLDQVLRDGIDKYDYVFIDEAHRFRNEYTQGFEKLHEICFGKKVVLVSATPLNNTFEDIYSQLKLFQIPRHSTIPGVPDLDAFFKRLIQPLRGLRKSDPEYGLRIKEGSKEIREEVLSHVMIRRTRSEIMRYYRDDIEERGLSFPTLEEPRRIAYRFDEELDRIFSGTFELLKTFCYSRYTPLLYLKEEPSALEAQSQRNVGGFMKGVLVKRLESSFFAFRRSLARFIESYERFIEMLDQGSVLISKRVNVYDLLEEDDEARIQELVEQETVDRYSKDDFRPQLKEDLEKDLALLREVAAMWEHVTSDPKLDEFIDRLRTDREIKGRPLIVFTESKETGEHLFQHLEEAFPGKALFNSSQGGLYGEGVISVPRARELIRANFDPTSREQADDIKILVSTDVLAEGVNLHTANAVLNYDLPWNPTKVLQRVGRVNRVGSEHTGILVYNFFPTDQSEEQIGLEACIKNKIQAFHDTLGEDAKYLTEEEVVSAHELFGETIYKRLSSKKTYGGDEEEETASELEYLMLLRKIRDGEPDLFKRIKQLPKKARSAKAVREERDSLITFFRKGRLKKFYVSDGQETLEVSFLDAARAFECDEDQKRTAIPREFYERLSENKAAFSVSTSPLPELEHPKHNPRSNEAYIIRRLRTPEFRDYPALTDEDEDFVERAREAFESGVIPRNTAKRIKRTIEKETNPLKVIGTLRNEIPGTLLQQGVQSPRVPLGRREVILSEYLVGGSGSGT